MTRLEGAGARLVVEKILPEVLETDMGMTPDTAAYVQEEVSGELEKQAPDLAKSRLKSVTVWGGTLSVLAGAVDVITGLTMDDLIQLHRMAIDIGGIIGGLVAIYGRIRATKVLK